MTKKYVEDYFEYLISHREQLENDEIALRSFLSQHFATLPEGKLYKYRACNKNNLAVLRKGQIYVPFAKEFSDEFDSLLKLDIAKNKADYIKWIRQRVPKIAYVIVKAACKEKGIEFNVKLDLFYELGKYYDQNGLFQVVKFKKDFERVVTRYFEEKDMSDKEKAIVFVEESQKKITEAFKQFDVLHFQEGLKALLELPRAWFRERLLIYCLTHDNNNRKMWEDYADKRKGYCIEYDFSDLDKYGFEDLKKLLYFVPVYYAKNQPYFNVQKLFDFVIDREIDPEISYYDYGIEKNVFKVLPYKHSDFACEREWRLYVDNIKGDIHSNIFDFPFISAIYMGHDVGSEDEKRLKTIAKNLKIKLYKQEIDEIENEYVFEQII